LLTFLILFLQADFFFHKALVFFFMKLCFSMALSLASISHD
jgi:hypothetical protein